MRPSGFSSYLWVWKHFESCSCCATLEPSERILGSYLHVKTWNPDFVRSCAVRVRLLIYSRNSIQLEQLVREIRARDSNNISDYSSFPKPFSLFNRSISGFQVSFLPTRVIFLIFRVATWLPLTLVMTSQRTTTHAYQATR